MGSREETWAEMGTEDSGSPQEAWVSAVYGSFRGLKCRGHSWGTRWGHY